MRRFVLLPLALCLACSLHASVSKSTTTNSLPLKTGEHQFRAMVQEKYQKATRDKAPLTASPADGKSFVNEFMGAPEDGQNEDKTVNNGENTAQLPQ